MTDALKPGARIGILGGGQLGRMLSVAASRLGYRCHFFEPGAEPPAGHVAAWVTTASYDDEIALTAFAQSVDVVTFEFENIPASALDTLEQHVAVHPGRRALEISQDRLVEKDFLTGLGLKTAPYRDCPDLAALQAAMADIGPRGILKTRRLGYDGKGQVRVGPDSDLGAALDQMAGAPSILEGFVDFSCEISVIAARGSDGQVACFDPGRNTHRDGILHTTEVPAGLPAATLSDAVLMAARIVTALDYVGVMGVELFVTPQGLIVNEVAPRVHNSGHWTQNACPVDQFEQHIRAVAGLPLADAARVLDARMLNLIGNDAADIGPYLADPSASVHLYGKSDSRPGRKMGHVNVVSPRADAT